ncbi:TetR family transcriptional regulator [Niveispirillum sp. SYP-B3756]|nr:TetR family transcriptional regulator [Niveispirillum sp. SYP-B3756]
MEKNEATRLTLIEAAAKIVGRYGYSGCSIARVTAKAKVAHGTFYLHFKSQQELFDLLLPTLGARMLDKISDAVRNATSLLEVERRGLEANFAYLVAHPYMYRLMMEAELFAPTAFRAHVDMLLERYVRSLRRSLKDQEPPLYSEAELEQVASMLMGARSYLLMRFCAVDGKIRPLSPEMLDTYLRFVATGLKAGPLDPVPEAVPAVAPAAEAPPKPVRRRRVTAVTEA